MRALGNLLRLIRESHLSQPHWPRICFETIEQLQTSCLGAGNMKVKWNACYAIGNFMQNPVLFTSPARPAEWLNMVMPALCRLVVTHPYFKVRINAATALAAVPAQRTVIQEHYFAVWKALLEALEQSDHMADYAEYQHRDNLVDQVAFIVNTNKNGQITVHSNHQLCLTIAHFVCMANVADLANIANIVQRFDSIPTKWKRVISRILPDRAAPLLSATRHLKELETAAATVESQRGALATLQHCFVPLTI